MRSKAPIGPVRLSPDAESVLAVLAAAGADTAVRLNAIAAGTRLSVANVGRHLRTLEAARLARYEGGLWRIAARGERHVAATRPAGVPPVAA